MLTYYLHIPHGTTFCIETDCSTLAKQLHLKHGTFFNLVPAPAQHTITIRRADSSSNYFVARDGQAFLTAAPLQAVADMIHSCITYRPHIFALHGAAVAYCGQAHLFLAATTGGKTTLTGYLTANGFDYITDDCILLDREQLVVYPYPTPLHLRPGGMEVLERSGTLPGSLALLDNPSFCRYVYTPERITKAPLPLGHLFFITRTDHHNELTKLSMSQRIQALLRAPITAYPLTGAYLQFITHLARFPCYQLCYSSMNYVKEVLEHECQPVG